MPNKKRFLSLPPIMQAFAINSSTFHYVRDKTQQYLPWDNKKIPHWSGVERINHPYIQICRVSATWTESYQLHFANGPFQRITPVLHSLWSQRTPEFPNLCSILHDEKLEKSSLKNPTAVKPELSHLKRTVWPLNFKQENRSSERRRSKGFVKSLGNRTPCIVIPQYPQSMQARFTVVLFFCRKNGLKVFETLLHCARIFWSLMHKQ